MLRQLSRELNHFSMPLIMNNLFSVLLDTVMSALIGHISSNAIVTSGIIDGLMYTILSILGVGTLSFNIYASRIRESDPDQFKDYFKSIILLNSFIGILFVVLTFFAAQPILRYIYLFSDSRLQIGTLYAKIVSLQLFFNMLIFAMSNQIKVNKKTGKILKIGLVSSVFQVLLTFCLVFFVFKREYKVLGVGLATTLTLFLSVLAYLWVLKEDITQLRQIRSTKKRFLFLKSLPLFGQELLEGSIMETLVTIFLSRLRANIFAAYQLCVYILNICLTPMFMYCNGLVVMIGERLEKHLTKELRRLPKICLGLILGIYSTAGLFVFFLKNLILAFFTAEPAIKNLASSILLFVLLVSMARPFFEVYKYSLQSFGNERQVLFLTFVVNGLALIMIVLLYYSQQIDLYKLLLTVAVNYLLLAYLFRKIYLTRIEE